MRSGPQIRRGTNVRKSSVELSQTNNPSIAAVMLANEMLRPLLRSLLKVRLRVADVDPSFEDDATLSSLS